MTTTTKLHDWARANGADPARMGADQNQTAARARRQAEILRAAKPKAGTVGAALVRHLERAAR